MFLTNWVKMKYCCVALRNELKGVDIKSIPKVTGAMSRFLGKIFLHLFLEV